MTFAEFANTMLRGPEVHVWLNRLEEEPANFRAALECGTQTQMSELLPLSGVFGLFKGTMVKAENVL